jgi:hypothetical protein
MPHDGWPPIDEPELRRRLTLDDAAFRATYCAFLRSVGTRRCTERDVRRALAYPWSRPASSFRLEDGVAGPLDPAAAREGACRVPLLAIGSNGAPRTLARKLAHLPPRERSLAVEAGALHGFDVAATAFPTVYGSFAATLVPSPGTALRCAVLWVSAAQLTALAWTETSYRLGRLAGVRFVPDVAGAPAPAALYAFVSRWGAFAPGGVPQPLAALPAEGRRAAARTQEDLLTGAARRTLGPAAGPEALVGWIFADLLAAAHGLRAALEPSAQSFAWDGWEPYGA